MPDDLFTYADNTARLYRKPGTSSKAASGAAVKAPSKKQIILSELAMAPATPEEICARHGGVLNTWRARMCDLYRPRDEHGNRIAPFVVPTGETRTSAGNRESDVMRLTTAAERRNWKR